VHARSWRFAAVAAASVVVAWTTAGSVSAAGPTHYTGTLADGGSWIADIPSPWNGTLLLYSHGYGSNTPADAPDPNTQQALLDRGYALAGSSYDPSGSLWALGSALPDQFATLQAVEQTVLPSQPQQVLAVGTSMGGLVSALEDENANGRIDGALTTCGLIGGGVKLSNYQLDQEYAMSRLLAPGQQIKLVGFNDPGEAVTTAQQLNALAAGAQTTPQGRARLALSMAFGNVATWAGGQPMPARTDYDQQEQEQYDVEFGPPPPFFPPFLTALGFVVTGRQQIELAAGGNVSWTAGVDFARLFASSPYAQEVQALYRKAGLDLRSDLADLAANANITADPGAVEWMRGTSVPTGQLQVPELDLHTISDQLIPVQNENAYAALVRTSGANSLFRQAFVERVGHCNFTPSELVAGVLAVQHRVETGGWDSVAEPNSLNASAAATGLGDSAFIQYQPDALTGDNETLRGGGNR
jgi:hypothetical protein